MIKMFKHINCTCHNENISLKYKLDKRATDKACNRFGGI